MSRLFDHMRRELQAEAATGPHPESDVLNAYMEGVLADKEREAVITHLGCCAQCREVVALAAPPLAQTPPPASLKDPAVRLALWRWAVVATTAVVVIAAVLVDNNRRASAPEPSPTMAAPAAAPPQESAPATDAATAAIAAKQTPQPAAPAKTEAGQVTAKLENRDVERKKAPAIVAKAAPPAQAEKDEVALARPMATPQAQSAPMAAPAPRRDVPADIMAQAGAAAPPAPPPPPSPAFAEVASAPANAGMMKMKAARAATTAMDSLTVAPRWTISAQGRVQKSLDGGNSWQTVSVDQGVRFRAIAAIGADIWAGGARAALFHSSDGGQTWSRVLPGGLSGDIVRLDFHDPRHGDVSTSAGETCSTADGGRTWLCR